MMKSTQLIGTALAAALALAATTAQARDQIRIVGSSTVFPFSSFVAEEFGATTDHPTPVVESTGSGGGMKLFCGGAGMGTPDITNASRRIKPSELELCRENGVSAITEAMIGYDGIVLAQNKRNEPINLSREQLTLAVAHRVPQDGELVKNPYDNWQQIDDSLPDREILIYGPPGTSGTRDAFEELVMEAATEDMAGYDGAYSNVRQDGKYIPSGENDNLIVQKLERNRKAFGVFGFAFLEENRGRIQGASIDGVEPRRELISSGEYPVSRSLFFYIKNSHQEKVPGMAEYIELFLSDKMIGDRGALKRLGLIPLPEDKREKIRKRVADRVEIGMDDLE